MHEAVAHHVTHETHDHTEARARIIRRRARFEREQREHERDRHVVAVSPIIGVLGIGASLLLSLVATATTPDITAYSQLGAHGLIAGVFVWLIVHYIPSREKAAERRERALIESHEKTEAMLKSRLVEALDNISRRNSDDIERLTEAVRREIAALAAAIDRDERKSQR